MIPQKGNLDFSGQQEILTEIGKEILSSAPDTWEEITYTVHAIVSYREEEMLVRHQGGELEKVGIPVGTAPRVSKLRAGMYQEGKGAWFSMEYTITRPGKFTTKFDYENEPEFIFKPSPENYTQEIKHFPRTGDETPPWLREMIRPSEEDTD